MKQKHKKEKRHTFPIRLKKRLGQHILKDKTILKSIAEECGIGAETLVIEIGAGIGNLTEFLALKAQKVIAIEIDTQFTPYHKRISTRFSNIQFLYENVLDMDWDNFPQGDSSKDLVITGNIPYNITSPLIMKILRSRLLWRKIVFLVQKELGMRLTAPPGTKKASSITLKISYLSHPRFIRVIPSHVFSPPPKVESAIISFLPEKGANKEPSHLDSLFWLLDAAFSQRRKTVLNSLGHSLKNVLSREDLKNYLEESGVDPRVRPEAITLEKYLLLFKGLKKTLENAKIASTFKT